MLSIFPALVAMIALVGLVGNPQTITKELTKLVSSIGPASTAQTFKEPIASLAHGSSATGILLIVGVALALWTASGYVGAFMRASNRIYEVEEGRNFSAQDMDSAAPVALLGAEAVATFFPDGQWKSNFLCNLGYGDPASIRPRKARLDFDEACRIS